MSRLIRTTKERVEHLIPNVIVQPLNVSSRPCKYSSHRYKWDDRTGKRRGNDSHAFLLCEMEKGYVISRCELFHSK